MEHAAFIGSLGASVALVGATLLLERRYPLLSRRDPERALAAIGHAMNPLLWRGLILCWPREALVPALARFAFVLAWLWRCEERWLSFPHPDGRPRYRIPMAVVALASLFAGASGWQNCSVGETIASLTFLVGWTVVLFFSHALEKKMPREHSERELVWVIWACVSAPSVAAMFVDEPWKSIAFSLGQAFVSTRLLADHIRRAIARDEEEAGRVYETIYMWGGELRNGVEVLYTPMQADFLDHCRSRDPERTALFAVARDFDHGAVSDALPSASTASAARALNRYHWTSYVNARKAPPLRILRAIDGSDDEETSEA